MFNITQKKVPSVKVRNPIGEAILNLAARRGNSMKNNSKDPLKCT
jgi:hypothetical protein